MCHDLKSARLSTILRWQLHCYMLSLQDSNHPLHLTFRPPGVRNLDFAPPCAARFKRGRGVDTWEVQRSVAQDLSVKIHAPSAPKIKGSDHPSPSQKMIINHSETRTPKDHHDHQAKYRQRQRGLRPSKRWICVKVASCMWSN